MLYDRPVSVLMADAAGQVSMPCKPGDIVAWFAGQYPAVKGTTVRAHIIGLTANDRNRHHYPWLARRTPLFYRLSDGSLDRFDPDEHVTDDVIEAEGDSLAWSASIVEAGELGAEPAEFYLEAHLEDFLLRNWDRLDWGRRLALWMDGERTGHQLRTPVGKLDFLCVDRDTEALVVVELKRGLPNDAVVGQIARYIGCVRSILAEPDQPVEGIIVAHEANDALRYAVSAVPGLHLLVYEISFALRPVPAP